MGTGYPIPMGGLSVGYRDGPSVITAFSLPQTAKIAPGNVFFKQFYVWGAPIETY